MASFSFLLERCPKTPRRRQHHDVGRASGKIPRPANGHLALNVHRDDQGHHDGKVKPAHCDAVTSLPMIPLNPACHELRRRKSHAERLAVKGQTPYSLA